MYKILILLNSFILLLGCNQHSNLVVKKTLPAEPFVYLEKPFELKWKIEKKSIITLPENVNKKLKAICNNHNKVVLVKVKTFSNDTAIGTFDCRI